jgi:hypothetical protein
MAYTERSDDDPALSVEQALSRARRWRLVGAVVLVPVVIGAVATVALYATRANPPAPNASESRASDTVVRDGSVLIIQPRSTEQVKIPVGQVIEIVIQSGSGQAASSVNPAILVSIPVPPCHVFTLCGIPGVQTFAFRAVAPGTTDLKITFGVDAIAACRPSSAACFSNPPVGAPLIKPVTVSVPRRSG